MNRRRFLLTSAVIAVSFPLLGIGTCASRQETIAQLVHILGNAVASLASALGNVTASQQLVDHTNTAVAIIKAWKPGMNSSDAIRALNRVIDDINHVEGLDKYKPLITLALGTAAALIDMIRSQSGGNGEQPHTNVRLVEAPHDEKEFKLDWDGIRAGSTDLKLAPVL